MENGRRKENCGGAPGAVVVRGQRQQKAEDSAAVQALAHEDYSEELPDVVAMGD